MRPLAADATQPYLFHGCISLSARTLGVRRVAVEDASSQFPGETRGIKPGPVGRKGDLHPCHITGPRNTLRNVTGRGWQNGRLGTVRETRQGECYYSVCDHVTRWEVIPWLKAAKKQNKNHRYFLGRWTEDKSTNYHGKWCDVVFGAESAWHNKGHQRGNATRFRDSVRQLQRAVILGEGPRRSDF